MTTFAQVQELALTLPETTSSPSYGGAPALRVNKLLFARLRGEMADEIDELTGKPYGEVLMVRVADLGEKEALLASDQRAYFTVAHYDGTRRCWSDWRRSTPQSCANWLSTPGCGAPRSVRSRRTSTPSARCPGHRRGCPGVAHVEVDSAASTAAPTMPAVLRSLAGTIGVSRSSSGRYLSACLLMPPPTTKRSGESSRSSIR